MDRLTFYDEETGLTLVKDIDAAIDKLDAYESAEENGRLFKLECTCKECVHVDFAGCMNTTCYCMKHGCFMQEDDFCKYAEMEGGQCGSGTEI